jgi:Mrp family chromosome partitioning ATPase
MKMPQFLKEARWIPMLLIMAIPPLVGILSVLAILFIPLAVLWGLVDMLLDWLR